MICPFITRQYLAPIKDARPVVIFTECERENCALWAREVKGRSVAGCSITLGAASLLAIATMLEKNLAK